MRRPGVRPPLSAPPGCLGGGQSGNGCRVWGGVLVSVVVAVSGRVRTFLHWLRSCHRLAHLGARRRLRGARCIGRVPRTVRTAGGESSRGLSVVVCATVQPADAAGLAIPRPAWYPPLGPRLSCVCACVCCWLRLSLALELTGASPNTDACATAFRGVESLTYVGLGHVAGFWWGRTPVRHHATAYVPFQLVA